MLRRSSKARLLSPLFFNNPNPIFSAGGKAAAAVCSVEEADKIVQVALEKFGGVHVLVANAGILRDKSFQAMTEQEWDLVMAVHLRCVLPLLTLAVSAYRPFQWHLQGKTNDRQPITSQLRPLFIVCQGCLAHFPDTKIWSYCNHLLASRDL